MNQVSIEQQPPSRWGERLLGSLCDILDSMRKPVTKKDRVSGEYPYYGATGILDYVDRYIFSERLVLIGEDGAKWGAGDRTAFIVDGQYWVNNHAHVIRPDRSVVIDEWITYYLNSIDLSPFVSGLTVPKLNQGRLREIPIPIPPLHEQKRIVAILDDAFERIDTAIANTEKNLANTRELFGCYLSTLFEQLGNDWGWKRLGSLCERVSVGHVGETSKYYCSPESGVPFVRSQNVRPLRLDIEEVRFVDRVFHEKLKKSSLKPGDLLFVRVGANRGDCCVVPNDASEMNCANIVFARLKFGCVHFYEYYFQSLKGKGSLLGLTTGSAQGVINTKSVADVQVPEGDIKRQENIVEKIDIFRERILSYESILRSRLSLLSGFKQSLLQKAFSGELTTDFNLDDLEN